MGRVAAIFVALVASTSFLCRAKPPVVSPFGAGLYDVALDSSEPVQATVRATLSVTDGQLFTFPHAHGYQWSAYIKSLRAYSSEGSEIPLTFVAPNHWRFPTLASETIRVAYNVDLSCLKALLESRPRHEECYGDKLYIVNQALFVMSDAPGERTVHFIVPASFKIASPLTRISALTYAAPGNTELASSTTVIERASVFPVRRGGTTLSKTAGTASFKFCDFGASQQRLSGGCTRLSRMGR
jgi:hypothetical protein